jgi:hypothetical protein
MRTVVRIVVGVGLGALGGLAGAVTAYSLWGAFGVRSPGGDAGLGWATLQLAIVLFAPLFALISAAARRAWAGALSGALGAALFGVLALLDAQAFLAARSHAAPERLVEERLAHASAAAAAWALAGLVGGVIARLVDGGPPLGHPAGWRTVSRVAVGALAGAVAGLLVGWPVCDTADLPLPVLAFAAAGAAGGTSARVPAGALRGLVTGGVLCAVFFAGAATRLGQDGWLASLWGPLALAGAGTATAGLAGALAAALGRAVRGPAGTRVATPASPGRPRPPLDAVKGRRRAGQRICRAVPEKGMVRG